MGPSRDEDSETVYVRHILIFVGKKGNVTRVYY